MQFNLNCKFDISLFKCKIKEKSKYIPEEKYMLILICIILVFGYLNQQSYPLLGPLIFFFSFIQLSRTRAVKCVNLQKLTSSQHTTTKYFLLHMFQANSFYDIQWLY